jgi:hypothetical protein
MTSDNSEIAALPTRHRNMRVCKARGADWKPLAWQSSLNWNNLS